MRAISVFIFDTGISTRRCFDPHALRIRVNISAIGSLMLMLLPQFLSFPETWRMVTGCWLLVAGDWSLVVGSCQQLVTRGQQLPGCLSHAGDHPLQRQLAETDTAQPEATQKRART